LAAFATASVVIALRFRLYGAVPFQAMFVLGYVMVGTYSIRHLPLVARTFRLIDAPAPAPSVAAGPLAPSNGAAVASSAASAA
jgi:hypothetical protein